MQNPFTHEFGREPLVYVKNDLEAEIINNFSYEKPSEGTYLITGVRGSGKTVMTSRIAKELHDKHKFIVCNLNTSRDMIYQLASQLAEISYVQKLFVKGKVDLSINVISAGISFDKEKVFDIEMLIKKMLLAIKNKEYRVLVILDDIAATEEMREFAKCYQNLIAGIDDLPIYMLMTGLRRNFDSILSDERFKDCSFLTRSNPKTIPTLDDIKVTSCYVDMFGITEEEAMKYAKMVKGYAFGFQVLGNLLFKMYRENISFANFELAYLAELESSYGKLWQELSAKDKEILHVMATLDGDNAKVKRSDILASGDINPSSLNKYKMRLELMGLISSSDQNDGLWTIALPLFGAYAIRKMKFE